MRNSATSTPFQTPHSALTPSVAARISGAEACDCVARSAATEPAIAMTAPTERSTPPVAITSVIPSAASAAGAPRFTTSTRLPYNRPSRTVSERNPEVNNPLNSSSAASASTGQAVLLHVIDTRGARRPARSTSGGDGGVTGSVAFTGWGGDGAHNVLDVDLVTGKLSHFGAVAQHGHAVRHANDLFQFRRDEQDRHPVAPKLADQPLDFGLGADVNAARRLVKDHELRLQREPTGEHGLLLIAAAELRDRLLSVWRGDPERADVPIGESALATLRHRTPPAAAALKREHDVLPDREA